MINRTGNKAKNFGDMPNQPKLDAITILRSGRSFKISFPQSEVHDRAHKIIRKLFHARRIQFDILPGQNSESVEQPYSSKPNTDPGTYTTGVALKLTCESAIPDSRDFVNNGIGYLSAVLQMLDATGLPYSITDTDRLPLEIPSCTNEVDRFLLTAFAQHDRLIIRHGSRVDIAKPITRICQSFPELRIVVVVSRIKDLKQIHRQLARAGIKASESHSNAHDGRFDSRITVSTYQSCGHHDVRIWDADIIIFTNIEAYLHETVRSNIAMALDNRPTYPRILGFAPVHFQPSVNQYKDMVDDFGTIEVLLPSPHVVNRNVEYIFLRLGGVKTHRYRSAPTPSLGRVKSSELWRNPIRNRLIARLACALRDGQSESVIPRFKELSGHPIVGRPASVLVVVENLAHHDELLRQGLISWHSVDRGFGSLASRSFHPHDIPGQSPSAVAAFDAVKRMKLTGFDVVIRADAGTGQLPLSASALFTTRPDVAPLLVIDFNDICQPELKDSVKRRRNAYQSEGWVSADGKGLPGDLARFLRRHPYGESLRREIMALASEIRG